MVFILQSPIIHHYHHVLQFGPRNRRVGSCCCNSSSSSSTTFSWGVGVVPQPPPPPSSNEPSSRSRVENQVVACTDATEPTASKTTSAGNFMRLKAHRVRSLALRTANKLKLCDAVDNNDVTTEGDETIGQEERLCVLRSKQSASGGSHETRQDVDHRSEVLVVKAGGAKQLSSHISRPASSKSSQGEILNKKEGIPVSRRISSFTPLRGWDDGGGGTAHMWVRSNPNANHHKKKPSSWKAQPTNGAFFSQTSFDELGCNSNIIEFLRSHHIVRPSHIQALAFAPVIRQKSCIIADQSGSGKTLAYLLPVIQRIRQEELQGLGKSLPQSPRVLILVPTAELACQVLSHCRRMSKYGVPFRSMVATGGFNHKTQLESLQQNLDVLIATPGRFLFLIGEGSLHLTNLTCVILDEVDILLNDEDYVPALQSLIKSSPVTAQYLFVTATLPVDIYNKLIEVFPDCEMIMGPGMHRTSPGLEEVLVDCSGDEGTSKTPDTAFSNKKSALLKLVKEIPVAKTIVFCNKIETCRKVENALKRLDRKGLIAKVLPFHSAMTKELQLANMEVFCSSRSEMSLFFICTDRASRGIDFEGVDRVVLFDFPRDPSEYVRRVGRTARGAGGKGKAFIFVVGKQVSLARRIIERNRKGHPLHDLPSGYYDSS